MSYQEKITPLLQGEGAQLEFRRVLGAFIGAVVAQVVLTIAFHIAIALIDRNDRRDERDRLIEARAFRVAYYVLVTSCFVIGLGMFALGGLTALPWLSGTLALMTLLSQVVLLGVVLAETAYLVTQVVSYRLGS